MARSGCDRVGRRDPGGSCGQDKGAGLLFRPTSLAPHNMAASFEMNLEGMVQAVAHATANHAFVGGAEWKPAVDWMWLLKAGAAARERGPVGRVPESVDSESPVIWFLFRVSPS
jgi:hypothetical protein